MLTNAQLREIVSAQPTAEGLRDLSAYLLSRADPVVAHALLTHWAATLPDAHTIIGQAAAAEYSRRGNRPAVLLSLAGG